MKKTVSSLLSATTETLVDIGLPRSFSRQIAEHLVESEVNCHAAHGLYRLPSIVRSIIDSNCSSPTANESNGVILVNGGGSPGIVAMNAAVASIKGVIEKRGIAFTGVSNYVGSTGAMGSYVRSLAEDGIVGIAVCHSEASMPPTGGKTPIFGTNPIAFGFPSHRGPIVVDVATSAWSYGRLVEAMNAGTDVPYGVVIDSLGRPSTNPNDADDGAMLPMASHKGYGLALMVELLCGPFLGGKAGREAVRGSDGAIVFALKANLFRNSSIVEDDTEQLLREILGVDLAFGCTQVRVPGLAYRSISKVNKEEEVHISAKTAQQLVALAPNHFKEL